MKTNKKLRKSWKEYCEVHTIDEVLDFFLTERQEMVDKFQRILEDNRNETLWGDKNSNEIMRVSIDAFITAVNDELAPTLKEPMEKDTNNGEFPEGKESYCPRCYFEDDKTILRSECPHNITNLETL